MSAQSVTDQYTTEEAWLRPGRPNPGHAYSDTVSRDERHRVGLQVAPFIHVVPHTKAFRSRVVRMTVVTQPSIDTASRVGLYCLSICEVQESYDQEPLDTTVIIGGAERVAAAHQQQQCVQ